MKDRIILRVLTIIVIVAMMGITNEPRVLAGAEDHPPVLVQVINDTDQPVPVTAANPLPISGTINLTGTSDVNVTNSSLPVKQDGTWTVGLSSSSNTVQVGNTSANPVPVSQVTGSDWEAFFDECAGLSKTPPFTCKFTIPSGKQLVVEMVTAFIYSSAPYVRLTINQCEYIEGICYVTRHVMALSRLPDGKTWEATNPVKIYAVGTDVTLEVNTYAATVVEYYQMSISGYAMNAP